MAINKAKGILIGIGQADGAFAPLSPKVYGGYAFSANYSINFTQPSKLTVALVSEDGKYDEEGLARRIFPGQGLARDTTNTDSDLDTDQRVYTVKDGDTIDSIAAEQGLPGLDVLINDNRDEGEDFAGAHTRLDDLFEGQVLNVPQVGNVSPISDTGGAITYDKILFGGKTFLMHPLKYSINEGPEGRYLQLDYYDRSITYLDKVIVALENKHLPPVYNPQYPPFAGALASYPQPNIIALGNPYVPARNAQSGAPGVPDEDPDESKILPDYLYSPHELLVGMDACPALRNILDASCMLLGQYAKDYGGYYRPSERFLKDYVGTLREVLNAWAQDLGFIFYWEPTTDKLGLMDLRSSLHFNRIQSTVQEVMDARHITDRTWSYSIEDTFSKGASAYWGRDATADGKTSKMQFQMLDLLRLNIHGCLTENKVEIKCDANEGGSLLQLQSGGVSGETWNSTNYCLAAGDENKWDSIEMDKIRQDTKEKKKRLLAYIRLLKASVISPEFYRVYILGKKLREHALSFPDWGGTGDINGDYPQLLEFEKTQQDPFGPGIKGAVELLNADVNFWQKDGKFKFGTAGGPGGYSILKRNQIVEELYASADREAFNKSFSCYRKSKTGMMSAHGSYIVGKDCLSIEMLGGWRGGDSFMPLAQVNQLYNMQQARLVASTYSATSEPEGGPTQFCRIKKYGLRPIISSPADDHIYKLLNAIATNQGRFYYSKTLETSKDFSQKSFDIDGLSWIDRAVDVNDTPFGALYNGADPTAALASVVMPNACVECKNQESKEKTCDDKKFNDPENTARPTVEQFIQSVYADTLVDKREGGPASLEVTVVGGVITAIAITGKGEGYLNGESGTLAGVIAGDGTGAEFTATITDGAVTAITGLVGGTGNNEGTVVTVAGSTEITTTTNIFGAKVSEDGACDGCDDCFDEANKDSILQANLTTRNEECQKDCEKNKLIDKRKGVVVLDVGMKVKIPNLIQMRIERHVNSFTVIPTDANLSIVTYHNEAGYQIVALANPLTIASIKKLDEYENWFEEREKLAARYGIEEIVPQDELDFIVDQVSVPTLDVFFDENFKDQVSFAAAYTEMGDRFEARAFVRPLYESNVRELTMEWLTPSEKDLGVEDADCEESNDPEKKAKKRAKDDKLVQRNIANYAQAYAYQQDRVEFNAQVTVVDDKLRDIAGEELNVLVKNGLESLTARISEEGTQLTYGVGTRRKRRVINKPFEDLWMRVKPEFYNTIFDV